VFASAQCPLYAPKADMRRRECDVRFVPKCMARPCGARWRSEIDERESCNNVLGLCSGAFCSGPAWVSARIRGSLAERPHRAILAPSLLVAPGRPFVHLFIPSRRPRQESYSTDRFDLLLCQWCRLGSRRIRHNPRLICATACEHRPGDAGELIGQRDRQHVAMEPL
jgi:hypothetical protein